jgi:hypothetical protein
MESLKNKQNNTNQSGLYDSVSDFFSSVSVSDHFQIFQQTIPALPNKA